MVSLLLEGCRPARLRQSDGGGFIKKTFLFFINYLSIQATFYLCAKLFKRNIYVKKNNCNLAR